jgi:two-component system nitrogen regulation sensor histidine kinase NtrY
MKFPRPSLLNQRRHRERFWVSVVFVLIIFFGCLEGWLFRSRPDLPIFGNIFLFALINLNVILLLLLAYLVLRNIVKLIFERKRNILGHKLRTRLVIAFVGVTLIPTIPLFWLATQFMFSSLDYWFSRKVEQSLEQAVTLAKDYLEQEAKYLAFDCQLVKADLLKLQSARDLPITELEPPSVPLVEQYHLDAMFLFDSRRNLIWQILTPGLPSLNMNRLRKLLSKRSGSSLALQSIIMDNKQEGVVASIGYSSLKPEGPSSPSGPDGKLVVLRLFPRGMMEKFGAISSGHEDYMQLKLLHQPLKLTHFITFSIVTLLVIFAAIWFGFFLAKNITIPIQALLAATQRVAEGGLDVELESGRRDEIGMLILSFNKMVRDLRDGREQLDNAYLALKRSHAELEDRRRYMEIVLKNIAAGVVSVDPAGRVMTMNKSAEATFGLHWEEVKGRLYSDFLQPSHMDIVKSFLKAFHVSRQPYLEQQVQVMMGNRPRVLLIKVSVLRDEQDQYLGVVVVLDDLTDLEKAQRMAAWREVARRIAHEIKNPLTPIQLCAQRLRRKYSNLLESESSVFDECTQTIIRQVDHMKHLVNEFSQFARLPRVQLAPSDLASVVEESMALYRHTHPHISFSLKSEGELPLVQLDRDQFKQVMINLFDNAIHALGGEEGTLSVHLFHDPILKITRLECADSGHGLSPEDRLRVFEPYYSTKEKGTGLGLAIVANIIADHNGFIRVRGNVPHGTVIVIELPG